MPADRLADISPRLDLEAAADIGVDDYDRLPDSAYSDDLPASQVYDTSLFSSSITTSPAANALMHAAQRQEPLKQGIIVKRPVIQLEGGQRHNYASAAEAVRAEDIYVRGGNLVRLGTAAELPDQATVATERDDRQVVIVPANQD